MASRRNWYDWPLLSVKGKPGKALSYADQRNAIANAFAEAGIESSVLTHIGRKTGCKLAEWGGAAHDKIARLGHWSAAVMDNTYMSAVPHGAIYAIAGYKANGMDHHMPRDVAVPEELAVQVFPWIKRWYVHITSRWFRTAG